MRIYLIFEVHPHEEGTLHSIWTTEEAAILERDRIYKPGTTFADRMFIETWTTDIGDGCVSTLNPDGTRT